MNREYPHPELLRECLDYDPLTGLLTWKKKMGNYIQPGAKAGRPGRHGYLNIGFQRRTLLVHRVVWIIAYGEQPPNLIDHINRVRSDNRLANLRATDPTLNMGNRKTSKRFKGVTKLKDGSYRAQIGYAKSRMYLGQYATEVEAAHAYDAQALVLFGPHAHLNFPATTQEPSHE